ncbi:MAG: AbrB/MazE/SpoVT family DNA-binding domain-containing protein [Thermofilaceae archaeon]
METVRVDGRGRVVIPKRIREKAGIREGSLVRVREDGARIVIEPLESIADRYFGAFEIAEWPENMDEYAAEAVRRWWSRKAT